ncbi:hypothetical protein ECANGB1_456 [Enterospora canceri]|uniref:Uncharacterized protein n=1 Tax=Enterospora canceri TaxID=1081671 RepID=A0A1Y1S8R6_9MICR|nr:hypothetical protein ECANGB1_456 [Enterospora canceri]
MVKKVTKQKSVALKIGRSNAVVGAFKALFRAICIEYLDPVQVTCSYGTGIVMYVILVVVAYPVRLLGVMINILFNRKGKEPFFLPKETLISHGICVAAYTITLIVSMFMFGTYFKSKKYDYFLSLLVSSCVYVPLISLVQFHKAIRVLASMLVSFIMQYYIGQSLQHYIYTPKDDKERQLTFLLVLAISFLLAVMLVAIV